MSSPTAAETCYYLPEPPRVWSRVQNPCTYIIAGSDYSEVYIPLTGQTTTLAQANYETAQFKKGNVLQYKGNSSRLTKQQRYSQIARGAWSNRTKVFATQSETYTNPNTKNMMRVGTQTWTYPNPVVGKPNNPAGPFMCGVENPAGCGSGNAATNVADGGTLVCGTLENPCSGQVLVPPNTAATVCFSASASNVPGGGILCWNARIPTYFPRQQYFMNNSGDKFPQGYKHLVSAVHK